MAMWIKSAVAFQQRVLWIMKIHFQWFIWGDTNKLSWKIIDRVKLLLKNIMRVLCSSADWFLQRQPEKKMRHHWSWQKGVVAVHWWIRCATEHYFPHVFRSNRIRGTLSLLSYTKRNSRKNIKIYFLSVTPNLMQSKLMKGPDVCSFSVRDITTIRGN